MEKLSIREASQTFGISRARLYQLLDKGVVAGYRSKKKGRGGGSWVHLNSLHEHFTNKTDGRPPVESDKENYISVRMACEMTGYTNPRIYQLIKQGTIASRKGKGGVLVYYPDLLNYKRKNK
ncbi:MAG: hypothetical protein ABFS56_15690 [Pseudomonadota bacterium]